MSRMLFAAGVAVALLAGGMPADAGNGRGVAAVKKQAESSLQVSGTITIAPDGSVRSHTLDPKAPLGEQLAAFVDRSVQAWRFQPVIVDGKAVTAQVPMHLRLVATHASEGKVNVEIASTYFGTREDVSTTDYPRGIRRTPPRYPDDALYMGGKGVVYLILEVGRDGKVANVDAEQVNLRVAGTEGQMELLRRSFSNAARRAAKSWQFEVPTTGPHVDSPSWLVRVPVEFVLRGPGEKQPEDGQWDTYIPGPRNYGMPWAGDWLKAAGSPDALPGGGEFPLEQGATLLSPPVRG